MSILDQIMTMDVANQGHRRFMLLEDASGVDSKKPNGGSSLRSIMVVVLILGLSALLSWCYHWEKIKTMYFRHTRYHFGDSSFLPTVTPNVSDTHCGSSTTTSSSSCNNLGIQKGGGMVAVVNPGDHTPNFIAMPSPHGIFSLMNFNGGNACVSH